MRLGELEINDYKNLKNFRADFSNGNGITTIIGNNGSGKSNIIEAISAIFAELYGEGSTKISCNYRISYSIGMEYITISKNNGSTTYIHNGNDVTKKYLTDNELIPSNVISIYSGEEDRLWKEFYKDFYFQYMKDIVEGNTSTGGMKLIFVNKYYWNIALFVLLVSQNSTLEEFIKEKLNIESIESIKIEFNKEKVEKCSNALLNTFISRLNINGEPFIQERLETIREKIYGDENNPSDITDAEVFRNLIQACMPKDDKLISNIEINFNNGLNTSSLSEGEKKLILIKSVTEFLSNERSLILLDEPDANIHEGRKKELYGLLKQYSDFERQIVLTTHSPTIAQLANIESLIMVDSVNGIVKIISQDKLQLIKNLTNGSWNVLEQNMILTSDKPIVVFEGKTDVLYVKQAIEKLKQDEKNYENINVDFINASGAGNMDLFVKNLNEIFEKNKKIIVFFDRDEAGKKGASALTGKSKDSLEILKYKDITLDNIVVSFIPYSNGIEEGEFLIEDYFSDSKIEEILNRLISGNNRPVKNLPNLAKRIKEELEKGYMSFEKEEFNGFKTIIEKIIKLIEQH